MTRCQKYRIGDVEHSFKTELDVTLRNYAREMPFCTTAGEESVSPARVLTSKPKEANLFTKTKLGKKGESVSMMQLYSKKLLAFRARNRTVKRNEWVEGRVEQVKRSKSFSALDTIESEERRKSSLLKLTLFERKKSSSNTISGQSEQERDNSVKRTRTFSLKSLGSSCLSLSSRISNRVLYSTDYCQSNRVIDPCALNTNITVSATPSNSSESGTFEKNTEDRPTIASSTHTLAKSHASKEGEIRETEKPTDSRFLVTRLELELTINKDDRSKLLQIIQCETVNLDEKDYYGKTLLHTACSVGNYHCAQILIDAGVDVNLQDQAGFTPLHCAVVSNHVPCAAILISSGATLMAETRTMHTALTLAHEDEMILLIGRSLLLRETLCRKRTTRDDHKSSLTLRETNL